MEMEGRTLEIGVTIPESMSYPHNRQVSCWYDSLETFFFHAKDSVCDYMTNTFFIILYFILILGCGTQGCGYFERHEAHEAEDSGRTVWTFIHEHFQGMYVTLAVFRYPSDMYQHQRFPELIFKIAAPDTQLELSSEFMAESFLKYRWKESLLAILLQLIPAFQLELVPDPMGDPHVRPKEGVPDIAGFLNFMDQSNAIPVGSNPHSIFIFCSLQNFTTGVYDTINANLAVAGRDAVSLLITWRTEQNVLQW